MRVDELQAKVEAQAATAEKILAEIKALKDSLKNVDLPPAAVAALARLDAALQAADEENPDLPPPPPPT